MRTGATHSDTLLQCSNLEAPYPPHRDKLTNQMVAAHHEDVALTSASVCLLSLQDANVTNSSLNFASQTLQF